MFEWMVTSAVWLGVGAYGMGVASALVPWLYAEVLMLSVLPFARSPTAISLVVAAITAGQMTGKYLVYMTVRRTGRPMTGRVADVFDRWQRRIAAHPVLAVSVVFGSALIGVPPFFMVSMAAGAAGMALSRFLVAGTAGRFLHFGAVAWLPALLGRVG
jgi:uncharacterized membrane protein YdjX (TVP38/TMEM64 family)